LYDYTGSASEQWIITPAAGGYYFIQGVQSGKVINVPRQSTEAGTLIEQWTNDGGANQQWLIQIL
jgi:hypothetical protein